jgi:hypothetical protein
MKTRPINPMVFAMLAVAGASAAAQTLAPPLTYDKPAPSSASSARLDAAEAPMLVSTTPANSFEVWYEVQKRPAMVVYFNRKLEHLPPGWHGTTRLLIDEHKVAEGKKEDRSMTIGVQHNSDPGLERKSQFATLFEQAVQQEMKRQRLRILDGSVLQRRVASAQGQLTDTEYASLSGAARFVFEVALVGINADWELVGELKDVQTGELTATVRYRIDGPLDTTADLDRASRALVQRLLRYRVT